jgi:hypothetical protein
MAEQCNHAGSMIWKREDGQLTCRGCGSPLAIVAAAADVPADVEAVWRDFWAALVAPAGVLDVAQVKRELFDYGTLLDNVPKVYMAVTGERISKPNTDPSAVIAAAEDHVQRCITEALEDEREAAKTESSPSDGLRPEVFAFARVMSAKIDDHNHDRGEHGWRSATTEQLLSWFDRYVVELRNVACLEAGAEAIRGKAANVANLAMMIADVAGALAEAKELAPVPTVVTGCQMKDTPETRELVAAAGRILAAPRPPKHACAGSGCPVCEKWMDDPRALSAPPPGEERLRERIEKIADECDAAAAVSEVDILGREVDGRRVAARLRAALREDEKGVKP